MKRMDEWELWTRICKQIKDIKPINKEEETKLYSIIKSGNGIVKARSRLVKGYLWLVIRISGQLLVEECGNRDDILNSGILELCQCADKFKVEPDKRFINFAGKSIKGRMWMEMRKSSGMTPIPRIKGSLKHRMNSVISLSTQVSRDNGTDSYFCELWEIIPDPNQIDLDEKIDRERFRIRFKKTFDNVLRDMPEVKGLVIDSEGLFGKDKISVSKAGRVRGMLRSTAHSRKARGLRVLGESEAMRELYNSL